MNKFEETHLNTYTPHKKEAILNRLYTSLHFLNISSIIYYRLSTFHHFTTTLNKPLLWLLVFTSELFISFYSLLSLAYSWRRVTRTVFLDRLPEDEKLPAIDVFVFTSDPEREPPFEVMNTVISVMALDYPPDKISVYLSDDGGSSLTLEAARVGFEFASSWVPFCRKFKIKTSCPKAYFDDDTTCDYDHDHGEFVGERKVIEEKYHEFRDRLENAQKIAVRNLNVIQANRDHSTVIKEAQGNTDESEWTNLYDFERCESTDASPVNDSCGFPPRRESNDETGNMEQKEDLKNRDGVKVLPFEFIALEACLEAACSSLDHEATTLEQEAHPALDKLTSKISTLNLERVRQIKSRLVALTGRVQKVRDELEHLLDDDDDMAEMYLTEKLAEQNLEESSASSVNEHDDVNDGVQQEMEDRVPAEMPSEIHGGSGRYESGAANSQDHYFGMAPSLARSATRTSTTHSAISKHLDVEELEMLLEAYFVQIDGTLNKLTTLREYVDDTEDYINIMLDDKQNHLLQMGVMLTTATLVVSAFVVVAGVFGMNITIDLFDPEKHGDPEFLWTVGGGATGTIILYILAIAWCKHKRLLE